jgi:electron transfer flavoprotein alpha subunit
MNCLVMAEHRGHELRAVTLELISAARTLGQVLVGVVGPAHEDVLESLEVDGVNEIVLVDCGGQELDPDHHERALLELIRLRQPALTLLASTAHSFSYGAAAAATAGLGFASDVHSVRVEGDAILATRSFYGGKVDAELDFPNRPGVLLILRQAVWPPAAPSEQRPMRTVLALATAPSRLERIEFVRAESDGIDITKAEFILAVGRGIGERENLHLFERLADRVGATLAVTRPLVDAGWVSADRQVGQSGKTVKPSMYLAFGISGASQHVAGMRSSGTVVAVNSDPNAAIFTVADYGGVFDAVTLAQELEKLY